MIDILSITTTDFLVSTSQPIMLYFLFLSLTLRNGFVVTRTQRFTHYYNSTKIPNYHI